MKRSLLLLLFIVGLLQAEVNWEKDFNTAWSKAEQGKKKMFVYMTKQGCRYCIMLDKDVLGLEAIAKYINKNFVPVKIDVDRDDYPDFLRVRGTPTVFILYMDGTKRYEQISGYKGPMEYLSKLESLPE